MSIVFMTFGTEEIKGSRTRLKYRAVETGWFDRVVSIDESSIDCDGFAEMKARHWDEKFHGYYFWKPYAILSVMDKMKNGDALVYCAAGCDINLEGKRFFEQKLKLLKNHDIVAFGATSIGEFSSSKAIGLVLGEGYLNGEVLNYPQIQASILYIRKSRKSMEILNEWKSLMTDSLDAFSMSFERIADERNPMFIQNRCDQTALGLLAYRHREHVELLKPDFDWLTANELSGAEVRMSRNDILPCKKKFNYKPYVMFVAGHVLPQDERRYDPYTHFIDVGDNGLERCTSCTGDNIGGLGDLAEETALYWIWKNVDLSDVEYVGFSTYRKPFAFTNEELYNLLEDGHDCIANKHYQHRIGIHRLVAGYSDSQIDGFREIFRSVHPEDYDAFCAHQSCGHIYPCNTFVMRREMFHRMCEYVFAVTVPYAKRHVGEHGRSSHSPLSGVFAEDIVSFFIERNFSNVKSVPLLMHPYYGRYYHFNQATHLPIIWGSCINKNGVEQFWSQDKLPVVVPLVKNDFKEQVKSDGFYDGNEKPVESKIILTKSRIIRKE